MNVYSLCVASNANETLTPAVAEFKTANRRDSLHCRVVPRSDHTTRPISGIAISLTSDAWRRIASSDYLEELKVDLR